MSHLATFKASFSAELETQIELRPSQRPDISIQNLLPVYLRGEAANGFSVVVVRAVIYAILYCSMLAWMAGSSVCTANA